MSECRACGGRPPVILPLSYGPDALCLRVEGGVIQVPWILLANELAGTPGAPVTVHHQVNGRILISVGTSPVHATLSPAQFINLCKRIGQDSKRPRN